MKPLLAVLLLTLTLPEFVFAKRNEGMMSNCTWLYKTREAAWRRMIECYDTLRFKPGERIADIGAKGANTAGVFSLFYNNLDITMEDIDSSCLNNEQVDFVLRYYSGINGNRQPQGIQCHVVIGNDTSTTLPTGYFEKVFFINTYHEVTKPEQMVAELYRILAPGGTLYVEEKLTTRKRIRRKDCHHIMPLEHEFLSMFEQAGFEVTKVIIADRRLRIGDVVKEAWYQFRKA